MDGLAESRDAKAPPTSDGDARIVSLLETVYPDLKRLARALMLRERPNHTLQPTALVHEAVLRVLGLENLSIQGKEHFFSIMVGEMRRVVTSYARRKLAQKRAGLSTRQNPDTIGFRVVNFEDIILVDQVMDRLAAIDPRSYRVATLRFFGGLTAEETAAVLDLSMTTVNRDWEFAKAWLFGEVVRK